MILLIFLSILGTSSAETINDNLDVGLRGSWQSKRFDDGSWLIQQGLHLKSTWKWDGVTAHVDLLDARVWGSEISYKTNKDALTTLYAGNVEIPMGTFMGSKISTKIGRQTITMNDQRYLANGAWALGGRTFDAAILKSQWESGFWHGGLIQLNEGGSYTPTDCVEDDCVVQSNGDLLWYWNAEQVWKSLTLKPYYLHLRQNPNDNDLEKERRLHSPGLQITGQSGTAFYMMEGTYQFGQSTPSVDHQAWMAAGEIGYQKDRFKTSLYIEHNTGDADATDNVDTALESFIGRYHGLRGLGDQVGGTNLQDAAVKITAPIQDKWSGHIQAHNFRMDQATGGLYTFNGQFTGRVDDNTEKQLGQEVDLVLIHKPVQGVVVKWGHSVFLPEGAKVNYVGSDPVHFSYLWMVVNR